MTQPKTETAVRPEAAKPPRRVGTFTVGITLVAAGVFLLVTLFWPNGDFTWALRLSPLLLISLGVETLLAARTPGKLKYDWVGMLLCCVVVCAALCFYGAAWVLQHYPEYHYYW